MKLHVHVDVYTSTTPVYHATMLAGVAEGAGQIREIRSDAQEKTPSQHYFK